MTSQKASAAPVEEKYVLDRMFDLIDKAELRTTRAHYIAKAGPYSVVWVDGENLWETSTIDGSSKIVSDNLRNPYAVLSLPYYKLTIVAVILPSLIQFWSLSVNEAGESQWNSIATTVRIALAARTRVAWKVMDGAPILAKSCHPFRINYPIRVLQPIAPSVLAATFDIPDTPYESFDIPSMRGEYVPEMRVSSQGGMVSGSHGHTMPIIRPGEQPVKSVGEMFHVDAGVKKATSKLYILRVPEADQAIKILAKADVPVFMPDLLLYDRFTQTLLVGTNTVPTLYQYHFTLSGALVHTNTLHLHNSLPPLGATMHPHKSLTVLLGKRHRKGVANLGANISAEFSLSLAVYTQLHSTTSSPTPNIIPDAAPSGTGPTADTLRNGVPQMDTRITTRPSVRLPGVTGPSLQGHDELDHLCIGMIESLRLPSSNSGFDRPGMIQDISAPPSSSPPERKKEPPTLADIYDTLLNFKTQTEETLARIEGRVVGVEKMLQQVLGRDRGRKE
ncbi:hypothetical protein HK104_000543 [Borealophlyctis nickersoniae]|nr:hypothetical protein HK104_000543 [Borealophlyctis nickersoniae]